MGDRASMAGVARDRIRGLSGKPRGKGSRKVQGGKSRGSEAFFATSLAQGTVDISGMRWIKAKDKRGRLRGVMVILWL